MAVEQGFFQDFDEYFESCYQEKHPSEFVKDFEDDDLEKMDFRDGWNGLNIYNADTRGRT